MPADHHSAHAPKKAQRATELERALRTLEGSPYRLTRPRRVLLEAVFEQGRPFSAADLGAWVARRSKRSGCDPVTVYRTLGLFEELGVIQRCDFASEMAHYEVARPAGEHHHHFVCSSCRTVEHLDFCVVEGQEQRFYKMGYTRLQHRLEFTGLRPTCSQDAR